ncbi:toxin, partial [Vibrio anguillarum]|nr:toxin [Vibrio anguillarum]
LVFGSSSEIQDAQANSTQSSVSQSSSVSNKADSSSNSSVSDGGNSNTAASGSGGPSGSGRLDGLRSMLGLYDIQNLYYTGHTTKKGPNGFKFFITLEAKTPDGTYYFDDTFLAANDIK